MYEITRRHRDKLDEYRPLLNEIVERILKECTDSVMRRSAVKAMCLICEEEEIGAWLKKDTQFWYEERLDIYEERYKLTGEDEKYWAVRYAGNFLRAAYSINCLRVHPSYIGKPEESAAWNGNHLRILDGYTDRHTDADIPDGWICEYGLVYARLSAAYFGLGDWEKGYGYLECALSLHERWAKIPDETPLELGNPILFGETKMIKNNGHILKPNGESLQHLKGISYCLPDLADIMTAPHGWEWFDSVRDEDRWNDILERAKAMSAAE